MVRPACHSFIHLESLDWGYRCQSQVASMLKMVIVWAEWLLRCESEVRSQRKLKMFVKLHVFDVKQETTYIAREE
jgi:hypothetical protein